ncbi:hypothetical protein AXG93_2904s1000 [Marchantia polymorpha subsp. ruderalis]|uniref:Uncharacterized protein n=1 Tax=Marchantia polymorpha subsp. ruderalis TaxID=1480154 RepID=A0A176VQC2_MARPO|nr:hypothetical protein AXG93_2904s1000 [Marchantia polymorpha subsp. ruderalis]
MELLTKEEEKQIPKDRDILAIEISGETIAHGPVQVDVRPTRERLERRLAKKLKVLTDDEEDPILESRKAETKIAGIWQSRTQAMPKKKANRGLVVSDSSDSSVKKTDAVMLATAEDKKDEPTLQVLEGVPSGCDTIDEVITSAEAFETSTLNKRPKGLGAETRGSLPQGQGPTFGVRIVAK